MVIEEEWFDDMNLTDGATFPMDLIKHTKTTVNQKIKNSRDTMKHIGEIVIKMVGTHRLSRYCMTYMMGAF